MALKKPLLKCKKKKKNADSGDYISEDMKGLTITFKSTGIS